MPVLRRAIVRLLRLRIWTDELRENVSGQDLVEYALMAGFVSLTAGAIMPNVASSISKIFSSVNSAMTNSKNQGS